MEEYFRAACKAATDFNDALVGEFSRVVGEATPASSASNCDASPSPVAEAPLLDVRQFFRPLAAEPCPAHCRQFEALLRSILARRTSVARKVVDFLFEGTEKEPHARLVLSCEAGQSADCDVDRLPAHLPGSSPDASPSSSPHNLACSDSWQLPAPQDSYADARVSAVLLRHRPSVIDVEVHGSMGSPADLPRLALDLLQRTVHLLGWLVGGSPARLGRALKAALPNTAAHAELFVKLDEVSVEVERAPKGSRRLVVGLPLDLDTMAEHYESVASLVRHFDDITLTARHPETKATLLTATLKKEHITLSVGFVDGQPAWSAGCSGEWAEGGGEWAGEAPNEQIVAWSAGGTFAADIEIEGQARLLGLLLPAVWLPSLTFHLRVESGAIHLTCLKVGEQPAAAREVDSLESVLANLESAARAALEGAGSVLFDLPRFRQLMTEEFRIDLAHPRRGDSEGYPGWTLRPYFRVAVPTSQVAEILSRSVQEFITEQVSKMGLVSALADLVQAIGCDANLLNDPEDPEAGPGERRPSVPPDSSSTFL